MKKMIKHRVLISMAFLLSTHISWANFVLEDQKFAAQAATTDDQFGRNMYLSDSGDRLMVGAAFTNSITGAVYIFERQNGSWVETATLTASDGAANDFFGISMTIQGDVAVVGATGETNARGSAYIFRFDGQNWIEEAKITGSDAPNGAQFGSSMELAGNTLMVGAENNISNDPGAVYVFEYDGMDWNETAKITASNGQSGNNFGSALDYKDNLLVVGALDSFTVERGAIYVYERLGSNWNELQGIVPNDVANRKRFGLSVAFGNNQQILVGSADDSTASNAGAVYVFDNTFSQNRGGFQWTQSDKLVGSNISISEFFGGIRQAISVDGNTMIVTAFADQGVAPDGGSAFLYKYLNNTWIEFEEFTASDVSNNWRFGVSALIQNNTILVGANGADSLTGAVYSLTDDLIFINGFE